MNLIDCFDMTYIISLRDRQDRRIALQHGLNKMGWQLKKEQLEYYPVDRPADKGNFTSCGLRGCFESHTSIWKQAAKNNLRSVFIMEDDVKPLPLFKKHQQDIVNQITNNLDWDIIYFGYEGEALKEQPAKVDPKAPLRMSVASMYLAHCYALNGKILPHLIRFCDAIASRPDGHPDGGAMNLDAALWWYRNSQTGLRVWLASRVMAGQMASRSDITPKVWDRLPALTPLIDIARTVKRVFA